MTDRTEKKQNNTERYRRQEHRDMPVIIALAVFCVFIFFWVKGCTKTQDIQFNSEKAEIYAGEFQVSYRDQETVTTLPAKIDAGAGDQIVITGTLSGENIKGNSMIFYVRQAEVSVYLDGELLTESDKNRTTPFPVSAGSRWYFFRLPSDFEGKELRIELQPQFDKYAKELPTVYTGTKASFIYMVLKQGGFSILCTIPILMLGVFLLFAGILLRNNRLAVRFFRFGLFAIATSLWSLLESRITQIFYGNLVMASVLLFSCFFLIPVLAVSFLLTFDSLGRRKTMHVLLWVSAGAFFAVQFLQITGIFYYIQMVPVAHILIILIIAEVLKSYIDLKRTGKKEEDISLYHAMLLLGVFCSVDIVFYYVDPAGIVGKFSKIGMLLFFSYLGYSAIRQVSTLMVREARHEIYRELAFTDIMTGLGNRTAFENKLSELRENRQPGWTILVADMNNLKRINDNFGHAQGDEVIMKIGHFLEKCFGKNCSCYRIGGDEFCVIGNRLNEKEFEQNCRQFETLLNKETATVNGGYVFSVAYGYAVTGEDGVDECFKKADRRMYEKKAEYKRKTAERSIPVNRSSN